MIKRANHKDKDSYVFASQADNIKIDSQRYPDNTSEHNMHDPLFDQKLELATEGLEYYHLEHLRTKISAVNALIIAKHILAMKMEANISDSRRRSVITSLKMLSEFLDNRPFDCMTREDVISYLNKIRRQDSEDPMHRWIGSYNLRVGCFIRFFKWLYNPDTEPGKRVKPEVVRNIQFLRRKEKSVYKPGDLWTAEIHNIFLKYCRNKRDRCYHSMAVYTSCRPHELLKLRIKDISFKIASGDKQFAEIVVSGKTKPRSVSLFNSLPYVKDWIDSHP